MGGEGKENDYSKFHLEYCVERKLGEWRPHLKFHLRWRRAEIMLQSLESHLSGG